MKICIVSSCGGHLTEVRRLRSLYEQHEHFYVINDRILLPEDMTDRTYFIAHAERNLLVLKNIFEAWKVLRKEKPTLILSTGAGPVVPFALIGKILNIPTIYIETITRIHHPSLTGKIMYRLSTKFYYQWESLAPYFPEGIYGGPLI